MPAAITNISTYVPEVSVDTDEVNKRLTCNEKTDLEWMQQMTGIEQRFFSVDDETMEQMIDKCINGTDVLQNADMILLSTMSDLTRGELAKVLADCYQAEVTQINHGCAGFIFGLKKAQKLIQENEYDKVAIITIEQMSRVVDWEDRNTAVLFGDACAVASVESCCAGAPGEILEVITDTIKKLGQYLYVTYESESPKLYMNGRHIYIAAIRSMSNMLKQACVNINLNVADLSEVLLHQANIRILQKVYEILNINPKKNRSNIKDYGNTSSCTIPLLLQQMITRKELSEGLWGLSAIGGAIKEEGLQEGAAIVRSFDF